MSVTQPAEIAPQRERPPTVLFEPYIPAVREIAELTAGPLLVGAILGAIFGASSLYLVLKVG
ncbi:MAG: hypothetical protein C5B57_07050, partial [Blastocatellia bacterium]